MTMAPDQAVDADELRNFFGSLQISMFTLLVLADPRLHHGLLIPVLRRPRLFAAISGGLEWRQAAEARTCQALLLISLQACNVIVEHGWLGVDLPLHSVPSSTLARLFFVRTAHCIHKHRSARPRKTFKSGEDPAQTFDTKKQKEQCYRVEGITGPGTAQWLAFWNHS